MARSLGTQVGNVNLRGRKQRMLSCRCCVASDIRERQQRTDDYRIQREEIMDDGVNGHIERDNGI